MRKVAIRYRHALSEWSRWVVPVLLADEDVLAFSK